MHCDRSERTEELLQLYALGEASLEERRQVERHLADCEYCRRRLAYLRRVDAIVTAWSVVPDSMLPLMPAIDAGVRAGTRDRRRSPLLGGANLANLVGTAAAATLVGLIVLALMVALPKMQEAARTTATVTDTDSPNIVGRAPDGAITPTPPLIAPPASAVDPRTFVEQMRQAPKPEIHSIRSRREVELTSEKGDQLTTTAIAIDSELAGNDVRYVVEARGLASSDDPRSITEAIIKGDVTYQKNTLGQWAAVTGRGKSSVETLAGLNAFNGIPNLLAAAPTLSYTGQREVKGTACVVFGLAVEGVIPPDILAIVGSDGEGQGYFTDKTVTSITGEVAVAVEDKTVRQAWLKVNSASSADPGQRFDYVFTYTFWDLNDPGIVINAPDLGGIATPLPADGRAMLQALLDNPQPIITSLRVIREDVVAYRLEGQTTTVTSAIEAEAAGENAHWKVTGDRPANIGADYEFIASDGVYYGRTLREGEQWQVFNGASIEGLTPDNILRAADPFVASLLVSSSYQALGRRDIQGDTCEIFAFPLPAAVALDLLEVPVAGLGSMDFFKDKHIERGEAEVAIAIADTSLRQATLTITGYREGKPSDRFDYTAAYTFADYNDPSIIIGVPVVGGAKPTVVPGPTNAPSSKTAAP